MHFSLFTVVCSYILVFQLWSMVYLDSTLQDQRGTALIEVTLSSVSEKWRYGTVVRHFPRLSVVLGILTEKIIVNIMSNVANLIVHIPFIDFVWIEFVTVDLVLFYITSGQMHCFLSNSCVTESKMQWQ